MRRSISSGNVTKPDNIWKDVLLPLLVFGLGIKKLKFVKKLRVFRTGTFFNLNSLGSKLCSRVYSLFKAVASGKAHDRSGKKSIACARGINKFGGKLGANSAFVFNAVVIDRTFNAHGYYH